MPLRLLLSVSLLWLAASFAAAQPYVTGQTYFGRNNYVEYRAGDLPLILTAPHGGLLTPSEIPDRTYGTTDLDTNTRELAIACSDEIFARTGRRPHLILCHLRRTKLDANREIVEAAQGNVFAEQAWNEFHGYIAAARDAARAAHGFAKLIDLHGHGHSIARLELGYALGADELNVDDAAFANPGYAWMSTLRTLALARPGVSFPDLIRGPRSLGELFNIRGVPAWPSATYPSPGTASFFDGGHIVRTHSCILDNDTVRGVQIECHFTGVRDSAASRADFATRFANVLQPYLWDNYGYDLRTLSLARIDMPSATVLTRGGSPLTITVRRTGWLGLSSTMAVSYGGTAVRGAAGDYVSSLSGSLSFAANQSVATFTLTPNAASSADGDKTIVVALAPTSTQTADTTPLVLTLGDGLGQSVRVAALATAVSEAGGAARFRLSRTQTTAVLAVPLAWSGTAANGPDYRDAPTTALFPAGVGLIDVEAPLVDDGRPEPDRTLVLGVATGAGFTPGQPATATVTLRDDDRPDGLSLWLRGDVGGNVARDSSGLDRHATTLPADDGVESGPVASSVGDSPAVVFDGVNDTLAAPKFALDPAGAFTLAFFARLDPGPAVSSQNIASYGTRSATGSLYVYLITTNSANGTVALRTNLPGLSAGALDVTRTAPLSWQDGVWRHYALSVGADGAARVYIDGVLRRTATGRSGALAADELLWFGWRPASGPATGFMDGALRDIRVYRRALPDAEVATLATGRLGFAAWLGFNGLSPALSASADPDGDGLSCYLEYGLASSPSVAAPAPRHAVGLANGRLTLSFLRETTASDLVWTVEASNDLGASWQTIARRGANDPGWTIVASGAAATETSGFVVVTDSTPLALQPRRFLRLRVAAGG